MASASRDEAGADGPTDRVPPNDLRITVAQLTLGEAMRRITGYESRTEHFMVAPPGMVADTDWPLERDFDYVETPVRVYAIEGHETKLVVPEVFALQLDAVRRVRLGEDGAAVGLDPELRYRALPEDFVVPLDTLPSSRPIRRLYLVNEPDPLDPWHRKATGNPAFVSQATTVRDIVTFYQKDLDPYIGHELRHEWAHCLCEELPFDRVWFDIAAAHEGKDYVPRDRALDDEAERHAVLMGEEMLSPDPARFLELTRRAPLQTVLLADELRQYLVDRRWGEDRPVIGEVLARVAYVEATILPTVVERLVADARDSPEGGSGTEAKRLLVGLDRGHLLNALPNVRSLDVSHLPVGAPRLSWLEENRHIEDLDLGRTFVGGSMGLDYLRNLPLRTLSLARTSVKGSHLRPLEAIATLQDLDLSSTDVNDAGLYALYAFKSLRRLDLSSTAMTPKAIAWLRERMPDTEIVFEPSRRTYG